tara:strand:+ start:13098 stop:13328 length:231 start_codon:yes stop_codon:yes gene_type:complete
MIHPIKGSGPLKPDVKKLAENLQKIWSSLEDTAIFTIGIRKNGSIQIISMDAVYEGRTSAKTPAQPSNQSLESYIG